MKKNIMAVYDLEIDYAYNFTEYFNCRKSIPFEIRAFTSVNHLMEFAGEMHIEILLISDRAMCAEINELDIGKIVILSEGMYQPGLEKYPSVYKYQSSERVLREVMSCYSVGETSEANSIPLRKKTEIIGIYSPIGRSLKTSLALTMGQILSRKNSVLYLNLEECAGFEELLDVCYEHTLSDVLYFVRQKNRNLAHKISSMTEMIGNMEYIPPVRFPEEIQNATKEEWEYLLDILIYEGAYEVLILDMGKSMDGLWELLNRCDYIYVPVLSDVVSDAKIKHMERILDKQEWTSLREKIVRVRPPYYASVETGMKYIEQLPYGDLGDYVRILLSEEKYE